MTSRLAKFVFLSGFVIAGCKDGTSRPPVPETRVDPQKVIDMSGPTLSPMQITIFTYADADSNGWPKKPADQEYVRFLQDRGIPVGFMVDTANDLHVAMVNASDVDAVVEADKAARDAGIAKPQMVPNTHSGG
jgi:hypothetical protein